MGLAVVAAREYRSGCPVNLAVEVLGDRWSLIVIRDIMFGDKRYFRELHRSDEGIAFNILVDRLRKLVDAGLLTQAGDPSHKQKVIYSLTEMSIELVPVFVHLGLWAHKHLPASDKLSARILLLADGGPDMWSRYQQELRTTHLGSSPDHSGEDRPIAAALQAAYESAARAHKTSRPKEATQ
jgi:DNA-binding HxlR family transcriptional regulator